MADASPILDIQEAAELLRLNDQTVRRLARDRRIPAFKVGAEWRFHRSVLDRWCQDQCAMPSAEVPMILVVDDDAVICRQLSGLLATKGFGCKTAGDGAEAVEVINEGQVPDLVILDLNMPVMDGPQFLAVARKRWPELPVIVLTGYPDSALMARALIHSPVMMLSKPFEAFQMERALKQILGTQNTANISSAA